MGSFDSEKLDFAALQLNPRLGDPLWDLTYMCECLKVWTAYAGERAAKNDSEKRWEWLDDSGLLVDSGATLSAVRSTDNVCTPTNHTTVTIGVSGEPITEPFSEQTSVAISGSEIQHSFLISPGTPLSLMGRDFLCKLNASIHCTPDGLFLTIPDDKAFQAVQCLQSANDIRYCWTLGNFNMVDFFTVNNIQNIAKSFPSCASLVSAMRPVLECCCVAAVNPPDDYQTAASGSLSTDQLICDNFLSCWS